jgi:putative addiction module component (TIGR02574 family)
MTAKQIEAAAVKLPRRDRTRITNKLIKSLHTERDREILELWAVEAERRNKEMDEGKEIGIPMEKVMAQLRAALRR